MLCKKSPRLKTEVARNTGAHELRCALNSVESAGALSWTINNHLSESLCLITLIHLEDQNM